MSRFTLRLLPTLFAFILSSCEKDEATWTNYEQELACLQTNSTGYIDRLLLDDGNTLYLTNTPAPLRPDTTYRALTLFYRSDQKAWLSDFVTVLAPPVLKYSEEKVKTDPLDVVALWKSGGYVNLRLALHGSNERAHLFGFHRYGLEHHKDGTQTMNVLLIHDQNKDPLYYTRETFLSLPYRTLIPVLKEGRDSVCLIIHTFKGIQRETIQIR